MSPLSPNRVLALCGGIGGAKLALGLYRVLGAKLAVVVNTGDDFMHLGLNISPDLDTVLYTLGGLADPVRGWGRTQETWQFMNSLRELGGDSWFQLGDRDLAMHVRRTEWLRAGRSLSAFAVHAALQFGVSAQILPMSDNSVRTMVVTDECVLPFQDYFVRRQCKPIVKGVRFFGAAEAFPAPGVIDLMASQSLHATVICPSNPYLSIDPILAVPEFAAALANAGSPIIAVSPIIGGKAVKGPTAKIMEELGVAVTNESIAAHYHGLIDGLVIDEADASTRGVIDVPVLVTRTMMHDMADRERLANEIIDFAGTLSHPSRMARRAGGHR